MLQLKSFRDAGSQSLVDLRILCWVGTCSLKNSADTDVPGRLFLAHESFMERKGRSVEGRFLTLAGFLSISPWLL